MRLQQEFGAQQSNVGMSLTQVRTLARRARRAACSCCRANAVAGGIDWKLRYMAGRCTRSPGGSAGATSPATPPRSRACSATARTTSSVPTRTHVTLDPTRTSLTGGDRVAAPRQERRPLHARRHPALHALAGVRHQRRRPDAERRRHRLQRRHPAARHEAEPVRALLSTSARRRSGGWNYGGIRQYLRFNQTAQATLHNFLRLNARATLHVASLSDDLTRGGPLIATPNALPVLAPGDSRANVPTTWTARTEYFDDEFGGWRWDASTGVTMRPASQWQASVDPTYSRVGGRPAVRHDACRAAARRRSASATSSRAIERSTLSARFRAELRVHAELHGGGLRRAVRGERTLLRFRRAAGAAAATSLRVYGATARAPRSRRDADGTYTVTRRCRHASRSRRSTSTDCRSGPTSCCAGSGCPGSTAFLIWQQSRQDLGAAGRLIDPRDLWDATRAAGDNFFVVKVSYWLGREARDRIALVLEPGRNGRGGGRSRRRAWRVARDSRGRSREARSV